jgi:hypothetical protein
LATHIFAVHANPVEGREEEFNSWYDDHMREIIELPGFVGARRFVVDGEPIQGPKPSLRYLILYEIESDDPKSVMAGMAARAANRRGEAANTTPMDIPNCTSMIYKQVGATQGKVG